MQVMTDETLIEQLRSRRWASRPATPCLDEGEIAAFVDGEESGRETIEEHLATCETCVSLAAALMQLRSAAPADDRPDLRRQALKLVQRERVTWWGRSEWKVALPAAAVLALAVGTWIWQADGGRSVPYPQEAPPGREYSPVRNHGLAATALRVLAPEHGAVVDAADLEVRWTAVPQRIFYEVQVLSDDGDLVWQGRTEAGAMRLPAGIALHPGSGYYLWVRAHLPDGRTLKSSAVGFSITRGEQGVALFESE